MIIKPEELKQNGYELLDKLDHKELIPFVKKYLNKWTLTSILYYGLNIVLFVIAIILFIDNAKHGDLKIFDWLFWYFIGFTISFLLIPLHEYIHVVAYRSQGARNTSYDANLKKFYFMALADRFVTSRKEFKVIALAPFTIISIILILLISFSSYNFTLTILGILLSHTAMCSGDFGLLSYFEIYKSKEIVTYDEVDNKVSYFWGREKIK
ncbi:MAG: DUF3267 domain-containing protein [Sphingobacteriia bacterium]|nr:DUF3267 domain-containing protein [Sphingobacteriia bacterium]